jgi:NADPH:quinone reductase-like Zn-dependent oxidoreductase
VKAFTTRGDGIDALSRANRATPSPGDREIVVTMRAAALNYRDLLVVNGRGGWKPPEPRIPLSDGAGVVSAIGAGVTRWRVGDRVAGIFLPRWLDGELTTEKGIGAIGGSAVDGVLAEQRVFSDQAVVRIPDHLTDIEAATLPVAAVTAWHALTRPGEPKRGEWVLIEGTGGVSLFALQFAHAMGARAIVISSTDEKLERARQVGATVAINYRDNPAWETKVAAATGGKGVDRVIEVVGGANLNRALDVVRVSGAISFIGLLAGLSAPIETFRFVEKNVVIHGIETGSREMFDALNRFIGAHALRPVVDRVFPFEEFPDAMRHLERGAHFGKIVVAF